MSAQGTASVNFGSGALEASVAVTGQAGFTAGTNLVEAWMLANEAVGSQNDDSVWVEQMQCFATYAVTGTGFTIIVKPALGRAVGTYNVGWVWN